MHDTKMFTSGKKEIEQHINHILEDLFFRKLRTARRIVEICATDVLYMKNPGYNLMAFPGVWSHVLLLISKLVENVYTTHCEHRFAIGTRNFSPGIYSNTLNTGMPSSFRILGGIRREVVPCLARMQVSLENFTSEFRLFVMSHLNRYEKHLKFFEIREVTMRSKQTRIVW